MIHVYTGLLVTISFELNNKGKHQQAVNPLQMCHCGPTF